jgi:glycosyltransferase involved in cell wall biosynthesis
MKILWTNFRRLDRDVDLVTYTEITKEMMRRGHTVTLVFPFTGDERALLDKYNVVFLRTLPWRIVFSIIFSVRLMVYVITRLITGFRGIIFMDFFSFYTLIPCIILSRIGFENVKFVLDIRTIPVEVHDLVDKIKERMFYAVVTLAKKYIRGITVITPSMRDKLFGEVSQHNQPIGIWTSGVSLEMFRPKQTGKLLFSGNSFVIMYHGILTQSRGLQETIKAMELIANQYPSIKFIIVGNGPAAKELHMLVRKIHLEDTVFFHKRVAHSCIPSFIAQCNIGILPFPDLMWWKVSSPLKLLEYLAMEKPVIVTDIEAHRNIIGDLPCGVYIKSNNPEDIAHGIIQAYTVRKHLSQYGKVGRDVVQENYSWHKQAEKLDRYFCSL